MRVFQNSIPGWYESKQIFLLLISTVSQKPKSGWLFDENYSNLFKQT